MTYAKTNLRMDTLGAVDSLSRQFGDRLTTSADERRQHGTDESYHEPRPPDAVLYASSVDEVSQALAICSEHEVPVIPFGSGTSLEGHVLAPHGGICIDVSRMDRILHLSVGDLDATLQAGVTHRQLNDALRDKGLFFPVDPGADASLGGMAATGASGTTTVRYGTIRENVLGLEAVLADGSIVKTGGRARKSSAGYDLTRLLIGSEGTLGIITQLVVRLYGVPEAISSATCSFPTVEDAVNSVIQIIQLGIPVARCEFLDEVAISALNQHAGLSNPEAPTLFFEFQGTGPSVREQAESARSITDEHDGSEFQWATDQADRNKLWRARHEALYAATSLRPGSKAIASDVCVPISKLAECITLAKQDLAATNLLAPILGHVGDGNFHIAFVIDPEDTKEVDEAKRVNANVIDQALKVGGTITGEHGIGLGKVSALEREHPTGVPIMRSVKRALDPKGIMNPGKVLD